MACHGVCSIALNKTRQTGYYTEVCVCADEWMCTHGRDRDMHGTWRTRAGAARRKGWRDPVDRINAKLWASTACLAGIAGIRSERSEKGRNGKRHPRASSRRRSLSHASAAVDRVSPAPVVSSSSDYCTPSPPRRACMRADQVQNFSNIHHYVRFGDSSTCALGRFKFISSKNTSE